jgi:exonuclease III
MSRKMLFSIFSLFSLLNADTECPVVAIPPQDRRKDTSVVTIMQYNVEWFFLDYYNSSDCPGDGCSWKNSSEASTHLQYISKIVEEVDPDIINFCEVEGCDELNALKSKLDSSYLPYLKKGKDTSTGQNAGMLTRIDPLVDLYRTEERISYPISGSNCGYKGEPDTSGVSKHYITEYSLGNMNIAFIGLHLIAFPIDSVRCAQREAQAQVIQNVVYSYIKKNYEIIVLGDLNDFDSEVLDANNNKPLSRALDILKGNFGTYEGSYQLQNAAEDILKIKRFTAWWDSNNNCKSAPTEFSMIDHILLSPALREKVIEASIYHGYEEFCGTYNSDHYPVIIKLAL